MVDESGIVGDDVDEERTDDERTEEATDGEDRVAGLEDGVFGAVVSPQR